MSDQFFPHSGRLEAKTLTILTLRASKQARRPKFQRDGGVLPLRHAPVVLRQQSRGEGAGAGTRA